jgi:hypothetical protein
MGDAASKAFRAAGVFFLFSAQSSAPAVPTLVQLAHIFQWFSKSVPKFHTCDFTPVVAYGPKQTAFELTSG